MNINPFTISTLCPHAQLCFDHPVQFVRIRRGSLDGPGLSPRRERFSINIASAGETEIVDAGKTQELLFNYTECWSSELGPFPRGRGATSSEVPGKFWASHIKHGGDT